MLRERLRLATRAYHDRIERRLGLPDRVRNRADYVRLLSRFHGFYAPLEDALHEFEQAFAAGGIDFDSRRKTWRLTEDLRSLGLDDAMLDALPRCNLLPDLQSHWQAWGCLYVVEGATLGGQILARQLRHTLRIEADGGLGFFTSYGALTGSVWKAFVDRLNGLECDERQILSMVTAANDTFACLETWMCPPQCVDAPECRPQITSDRTPRRA
jgi:heme oxygenase (biliverdin-IX-beta and delta-forming)